MNTDVGPPGRRLPARPTLFLALAALAGLAAAVVLLTRDRVFHGASEFSVLGLPTAIPWESAEPPAGGRGLVGAGTFITNAEVKDDDSRAFRADVGAWSSMSITSAGTQRVTFDPGPCVRVDASLIERRVRNVWGMTILRWTCAVEGAFSEDGRQYCFMLRPSGGGHAGYTVRFEGDYDPFGRILTVRFTEAPGSGQDARRYALRFRIDGLGNVASAETSESPR